MTSPVRNEQRRALVIALVGFVLVAGLFIGSRIVIGEDDEEIAVPETPPATEPGPDTPPVRPPTDVDPDVFEIPTVPDAFDLVELRDPFVSPVLDTLFLQRMVALMDEERAEPRDPAAPPARVRLLLVTEENGVPVAELELDGNFHRVREGETFGPGDAFAAVRLDIDEQCGLFVFGDEPFTVCVDSDEIARK